MPCSVWESIRRVALRSIVPSKLINPMPLLFSAGPVANSNQARPAVASAKQATELDRNRLESWYLLGDLY